MIVDSHTHVWARLAGVTLWPGGEDTGLALALGAKTHQICWLRCPASITGTSVRGTTRTRIGRRSSGRSATNGDLRGWCGGRISRRC